VPDPAVRRQLEQLEAAGADPDSGDLLVPLVWLCLPELALPEDELNAARRRALFVLAAGGDPQRELALDSVAAERLAGELDSPERRESLHTALSRLETDGLDRVGRGAARLLADPELAWRCLALALLADDLAEE
jgi:hypothetical protein